MEEGGVVRGMVGWMVVVVMVAVVVAGRRWCGGACHVWAESMGLLLLGSNASLSFDWLQVSKNTKRALFYFQRVRAAYPSFPELRRLKQWLSSAEAVEELKDSRISARSVDDLP